MKQIVSPVLLVRLALLAACSSTLASLTPSPSAKTALAVSVDARVILNNVSARQLGINVDYLTDNDLNRAKGSQTLVAGLKDLGVKFLRYPGGEKSDDHRWSIPPYAAPNPHLLSYATTNRESSWFASFTNTCTKTFHKAVLDFDQFMAVCQAVGATPVLVVPDGSDFYSPEVSRGTIMEDCKAWLRYALSKGYRCEYWAFGNETYLDGTITARQYGKSAKEFAQAMKVIDPAVKIGVNGDTTHYFDQVLAECAQYVDWLDCHTYPAHAYTDYSKYMHVNLSPLGILNKAQLALNKLAEPDKNRIFLAVTETGADSWSAWDKSGADVGHGLAAFDVMAQLMQDKRSKFNLVWNTRYPRSPEDLNNLNDSVWSYLDRYNKPNAQGLAFSVLSCNLLDTMVSTTSSGPVKVFASTNLANNIMNLFLLNKSTENTPVNLSLKGFSATKATRSVYEGSSATDPAPSYKAAKDLVVSDQSLHLNLPACSITVINLTK